jgi:hypothetical protein
MSEKKTAVAIEDSQTQEQRASRCKEGHGGSQSPRHQLRNRVELKEALRIACATLQNAVAGAVLMFYSGSILGTAIRAFIGPT